jgi:hypothetical protein
MRGWGRRFFYSRLLDRLLKDDVKGFSFTSDSCFMGIGKKIK